MTNSFEVNENSSVYYTDTYWNNFEIVRRRINERISGEPTRQWHEHFANETRRTFKRALILNCGNGWVERELLAHGLIAEGVGMDYAQDLIDEATAAARAASLPLTYVQANINEGVFPEGEFDLVVNHAAAHHIAAIDRVFRQICRVLPDDGWFVSMDYVGPHRNQYRLDAWEEAWELNRELPPSLRQELDYPPIPVMLVVDPTEAIHSELIVDTFHRYFTMGEFVPLGGAIAYPMLTHNARMFGAEDEEEQSLWIEKILQADDTFLAAHPESTLFAYFCGRPNKAVLEETEVLAGWSAAEDERERRAREERGGEYYERGVLATALIQFDEQRAANGLLHTRVAQLEAELQAMHSRYLYARARQLVDSKWVRTVRGMAGGTEVERRVGPGRAADEPVTARGESHPEGALSSARSALDAERRESASLDARIAALESEVAALQADRLYAAVRSLLGADLTRRVRSTRVVGTAERRLRAARTPRRA
jgi:SAM-dependent methyltransferase/cell division protein FtsB